MNWWYVQGLPRLLPTRKHQPWLCKDEWMSGYRQWMGGWQCTTTKTKYIKAQEEKKEWATMSPLSFFLLQKIWSQKRNNICERVHSKSWQLSIWLISLYLVLVHVESLIYLWYHLICFQGTKNLFWSFTRLLGRLSMWVFLCPLVKLRKKEFKKEREFAHMLYVPNRVTGVWHGVTAVDECGSI